LKTEKGSSSMTKETEKRVMQKFSKERIMFNKNKKEMNTKGLLHSRRKEASIITNKENILINQCKITEGLQYKENHSLLGM
jgi:hypothetical protein